MSLERSLATLVLAAVIGATSLAACESSPRFDPTQPPIIGTIDEEIRLVADGKDAEIALGAQSFPMVVDVPAAALPPGTALLARRIHGVPFAAPPPDDAGQLPGEPGVPSEPSGVLHFLPRDLTFAAPLIIRSASTGLLGGASLLWVHAAEDDARWTIIGRTVADAPLEIHTPGVYGFFYVPPYRPGPPTDAGGSDANRGQ